MLVTGAATAAAVIGPYVSLGDSYTVAPLVPTPTGNPLLCGRSTNNYPSDVARALDPTNGTDCWPLVPITAGDIEYFNGLEQQLNQVEANEAAANDATFVDTWDSSIGHDACKPPGVAWVNRIVPTSVAFPLHPNQLGEANMTRQVPAALG